MTHLSDQDHKAQMAAMKAFDEQMPCVGIFWYDPESHALCDVNDDKIEFSIVNCQLATAGPATCPKHLPSALRHHTSRRPSALCFYAVNAAERSEGKP